MIKRERKIIFITLIVTTLILAPVLMYKIDSASEVVYEETPREGENPGNGKIRITKEDIEKSNEKNKLAEEYAKKKRQEIENQQVKKEVTSNEIIEVVYNQLSKEEKETIDFDLDKTKINKYILKDGSSTIYDDSYIGKEVYDIEFTIKEKGVMPNNRIVFASLDDYKIIGYGIVD